MGVPVPGALGEGVADLASTAARVLRLAVQVIVGGRGGEAKIEPDGLVLFFAPRERFPVPVARRFDQGIGWRPLTRG